MRADISYQVGDIVPWHFEPGIIVASFFASLVGTLLTVELLHRKRLGTSLVSRLQLFTCAVSLGLVGIWCMHFIGNRSIELGDGASDLQMSYSPGFTFLSCVLPVIGLSFAFYIAEMRVNSILVRRFLDVLTGFLAGLSIVGMHYCGNLGTTNYKLIYPARFIIAACIIAVGDCIIALMLFFYFKEKWISVFWKRLFCALILSVAVCGMHYTASVGCTYQLKHITSGSSNRNTAVIVAAVLCAAAAVTVLFVIFYTGRRNKQLADRAQQVMLACAYFDQDGNIMVTNEGLLPSQKIAKRFTLKTFDEEFNTSHPVFHWIWKVSNDWDSVSDLIGKMRTYVRNIDPYTGMHESEKEVMAEDEEKASDDTIQFRAGFCVAAADLSDRLHLKLENLGVLFDRVTGTGVLPSQYSKKLAHNDTASIASSMFLEKGQLLFFTRKLPKSDAEQFAADGYRFAPPTRVEAMIARTMQIPHIGVSAQIKRLQEYAADSSSAPTAKQGTYLTCFAALGRVRGHFDVLVSKANQAQLPDIQLSPHHLSQFQIGYLKAYDGWSAGRMVKDLKDKQQRDAARNNEERGFILLIINALTTLSYELSEEWFSELTFNARPLTTHYGRSRSAAPAMLFGLTRLLDIHQGLVKQPDRLTFVPLDFFRVRASYYPGCGNRSKLRSAVHTEFGPLLTKSQNEFGSRSQIKGLGKPSLHFLSRRTGSVVSSADSDSEVIKNDSSSERGLVDPDSLTYNSNDLQATHPPPVMSNKQLWGGILATTDTVIVESHRVTGGGAMEMKDMIPRVTATALASADDKTFADMLYEEAKARGNARPHTAIPQSGN